MADSLRELVTILRYQLQDGELKKYVDGFQQAQKTVQQAADVVRGKLQPAVQQVRSAVQQAQQNTAGLRERMQDAQRAVSGVRERMQQAASTASLIGKNLSEGIRKGTTDARAAMEKLDARADKLRGKFAWAAAKTAAMGYALAQPVENAAKFERENQLIGNTANMSPKEIAALRQTIIAEAKATNQNADDLQSAIGYLVAAGMDANTAQASIHTIGRATTAAGADIQDMAQAAFTLQDALKINPSGLQQAIDILATAGKEGNVELKDMARVLPVLGAQFQSLKMQGPEAAATMAASLEIARKGAATADEAANNLQNFLSKILSPTTLANAQKKFGLDLYGIVQGAQKTGANPFEASLQAIMKATGGDQKKLGELFQDMQVQNFLRPMMQNWGEYQRIKGVSLNQSAGTTDRDFAKMMGTASENMKSFSIAADNLSKALGTSLTPAITKAANALAPLIEGLAKWIDKHRDLVAGITLTVAGLLALRTAIIAVQIASVAASRLQALSGALGSLPGAAGAAVGGLNGFMAKLGAVGAAAAGGWAVGTWINDNYVEGTKAGDAIGKGMAQVLAFFGSKEAQDALRNEAMANKMLAAIAAGAGSSTAHSNLYVSPSSAVNAGRPQWSMVPTTIANSQNITVNAQGATNPAAVGRAAGDGAAKGVDQVRNGIQKWNAPHTSVEKPA